MGVFNASYERPNYGWPCPGCYALNGSLSAALFPGTYEIVVIGDAKVLNATRAIEAIFDRGLNILSSPFTTSLSAGSFSAWPISVPSGVSGFVMEGEAATTGCSYTVAILTPDVYSQFQGDRAAINLPGAQLLESAWASSCPTPPVSSAFPISLFGATNVSTGDRLVFYNSWPDAVQFAVVSPIELSYLLPT